jgi:uncharacterized protein (UPF0261 family)
VLDVTAAELADELVGGLCSAGPRRLEVAGRLGLPQVVAPGAIDMVNFGPPETVPERYRNRRLYRHNSAVTLMRTSAEECAALGRIMADRLNRASGPLTVFLPLRGFSAIGVEGEVFHDPAADAALMAGLRGALAPAVEVVEMDTHMNHPEFARAMAARLDRHYRAWADKWKGEQRDQERSPRRQYSSQQKPARGGSRPPTGVAVEERSRSEWPTRAR